MYQSAFMIAGVPRSGTSWLAEIMNSSPETACRFQPLFSWAFKDHVGVDSPREDYERFLHDLYASQDTFLLQTDKREAGIYPVFTKRPSPRVLCMKEVRYHYLHVRFLTYFPEFKLIAIVRNPCAVLASWMASPKEFPPGSNPQSEWRLGACKNQGKPENFFGFYKWREATHIFLDLQERFPDRVQLIRYEDLVENPDSISEQLFAFVGLPFGEQTRRFLAECNNRHSDDPYSVFKHKEVKDRWRRDLDPTIIRGVEEEIRGTRLEPFLA